MNYGRIIELDDIWRMILIDKERMEEMIEMIRMVKNI